jgi:glyoxylase-like metal-dependent hydrolase (beta-lactamase superfamily II)/8-oxo-dGTP pyrophosphatase MutT (NUDIX family)
LSRIPEAASVMLARGPGSPETFLVARAPELRFFGGFRAFPGGRVHEQDADLARRWPGLTPSTLAAVRELFEEVGVLLARDALGSFPPAGEEMTSLRRALLAETASFAEVLGRLQVQPRAEDLVPAGALLTPAFSTYRFNTTFFVAELPAGQRAEVWPGELTEGVWQSAEAALAEWTAGKTFISPPTVSLLEVIRGRPVFELPERLRPLLDRLATGALPPIWFSPGVLMIPLFCQGLPPATYTNAYLVGTDQAYLLDPGPTDPAEQERLFDLLDDQAVSGRPPCGVVLTHQHPDHIGAAAACARRYGLPVLAHARTAEALAGKVPVDRTLNDGDRLELGTAPDGQGEWHLEALHTPGHAAGHLAFYEPRYRLIFAGDMVSMLSSVVIAPPEGDLAQYLRSLERLQRLSARLMLPAHGAPSAKPAFVLAECLDHRRQREEHLLAALAAGPRSLSELVEELYRGLPADLIRFARLQLSAGLEKLRQEGRARPIEAGDGGDSFWQRSKEN